MDGLFDRDPPIHGSFGDFQMIGVAQLKDACEKELKDAPAGKRTVLLKIDKQTPASYFEPVVEAVSQAGGEIMHVLEEKRAK